MVSGKTKAITAAAEKAGRRYFECVGGKSNKFWKINVDGCDVTVRYGRIGTSGTAKTKTFSDQEAAQRHAQKLIEEKMGKGYSEKTDGTES